MAGSMPEAKRRLWRWLVFLAGAPTLLILIAAQAEGVQRLAEHVLLATPPGAIRGAMLRIYGQGGAASLAAIQLVWLLSPVTAAAGYIAMGRLVADHLAWVTPDSRPAVAMRIVGGFAFLAMGAFAVLVLPGKGSSRCHACEQSFLSLLLLNQLYVYSAGGIVGYIGCMFAKWRQLP